jgi:CheY-like chemotaxis protein
VQSITTTTITEMAVKRRSIGSTTPQAKENYYYSFISDNDSFYHSNNNNNNNHHHYHSESSPLQNQGSNTTNIKTRNESFYKRILIVDDDTDITFTYKLGLERYYEGYEDDNDNSNKIRFEVYTYNSPIVALSEFKSNFYDLLLTDINMPDMNGFQLCQKILELDVNVRVCFVSAGEVNIEALREVYPTVSMGCFIRKPVSIEYLIKRLSAELD